MGDSCPEFVSKNYMDFSLAYGLREMQSTRLFCYASSEISRDHANTEHYSGPVLEELWMVPGLKKFHGSGDPVKKYQLVGAFINLLLQLLDPEMDEELLDPEMDEEDWMDRNECKHRFFNLARELRFLLTVLGDISLLRCDEDEEFQDLLAEFETVANEAGSLVLVSLFSEDRDVGKMDEGLGIVLNHIDLLKANIMEHSNILSSISRSACIAPKTSVMDSRLIVDSLISDLEDLLNREDSLIVDVKDEIKTLHQGLIVMQSSIKDIRLPQPSEIRELKEPLMRIGDMAHQAEYLIISFFVGDAPLWYLITRLTDINHKIGRIATELIEITNKYTSGEVTVAKYFSSQLSLQAKKNNEANDVTVGLEEKTTHILDKLVGGTERLQVISIFGMPGLGKTTLAKKLYNHPAVSYHFDKLSWCVVSQIYLRQSLLANILIHIGSGFEKDRIMEMEEESLVEHIYKTLKGRRYLIVMDDTWTSSVWDDLRRCFPDDANGSRIMFTTRNKDVAPPDSIIYGQPPLSDDESWELLEKKVFNDLSCPPELTGIGKKIAANCGGLPLALVAIAGVLSATNRERSAWKEVQENLASYIFEGGDHSLVMQILELSYKHLADHLKPCFLYFGAFREDEEIHVRKLMRLWNSEGFISKEAGKSAENVAEEYLAELIDKSLVMVARRGSDGRVKACVVHDLLRDLCFKICEEDKFLEFEMTENSASWSSCQHIRSFHYSWLTSRLYVRDMRLLRILDTDYGFKRFSGIEYLVNLRYLVINANQLRATIGRLVNLEYLRVEQGTDEIVWLPPAIVIMRKLRYIHVGYCIAKYDESCGSSQTNNLEHLSGILINEAKDVEMLKSSPHLRRLKCRLDSRSSLWTGEYRHFDIRFPTQLESLNVDLGLGVEEISLPSNIRKLTLSGPTLPSVKMTPMIGRLENLEVLKLESIFFEDGRWDTKDGEFQKLRFLKLRTRFLTQWNVASDQHFPKLQHLVVLGCFSLREIPCEIGEIATLQCIEVGGPSKRSLVESARRIQQEQEEMGNEELRVIVTATD